MFVWGDIREIVKNPAMRQFRPPWVPMIASMRKSDSDSHPPGIMNQSFSPENRPKGA